MAQGRTSRETEGVVRIVSFSRSRLPQQRRRNDRRQSIGRRQRSKHSQGSAAAPERFGVKGRLSPKQRNELLLRYNRPRTGRFPAAPPPRLDVRFALLGAPPSELKGSTSACGTDKLRYVPAVVLFCGTYSYIGQIFANIRFDPHETPSFLICGHPGIGEQTKRRQRRRCRCLQQNKA